MYLTDTVGELPPVKVVTFARTQPDILSVTWNIAADALSSAAVRSCDARVAHVVPSRLPSRSTVTADGAPVMVTCTLCRAFLLIGMLSPAPVAVAASRTRMPFAADATPIAMAKTRPVMNFHITGFLKLSWEPIVPHESRVMRTITRVVGLIEQQSDVAFHL